MRKLGRWTVYQHSQAYWDVVSTVKNGSWFSAHFFESTGFSTVACLVSLNINCGKEEDASGIVIIEHAIEETTLAVSIPRREEKPRFEICRRLKNNDFMG